MQNSRLAITRIVASALAAITVAGLGVRSLEAQQPGTATTQNVEKVFLTAGRSTVVTTPFEIVRIAITNPAVADATVVQPREILVDGKGSGTVSMIVWGTDVR